ncbi:hypothetical protein B0H15DRAFT_995610 [Mycena belliarum]|uniref:TLC domain-containing protein n=1 Tax=Mycena belliarum TaxID=1033014 RepID=A0AAD6ULQ3_9AGAR|nr:hypothetical protein B0H15DRAFT_995610 [Mycena belliae]
MLAALRAASGLPALPPLDPAALARAVAAAGAFLPSLLLLLLAYVLLAPHFASVRQRAWLLTTLASALMTAAALPFVLDFACGVVGSVRGAKTDAGMGFGSGLGLGAVRAVQPRAWLAVPVNRFFQAYLVGDLLLGALCYRTQVGLLTGWVHHAVYIAVTEIALRAGWAHVFCFCAVMELPTLLLGLGTLLPRARSNTLFAATFFATRIVLHLVLVLAYALPTGQPVPSSSASSATSAGASTSVGALTGSPVPALVLASVFPLHAMWFAGCIKGFVRRARAAPSSSSSSPSTSAVKAAASPSPAPLAPTGPLRISRLLFPAPALFSRISRLSPALLETALLARLPPGLAPALLTRLAARRALRLPVRPIRPRARAVVRRMSAGLVAGLATLRERGWGGVGAI